MHRSLEMRHPQPIQLSRRELIVGVACLLAAGCEGAESAQPVPPGRLEPWEPVDASFAGCHGACGGHAAFAEAGVIVQPGAAFGQRTYCPVSGAVFEIAAEHPQASLGGQTLWFCCAGCADHFAAHRDEVVRARRWTV